MTQTFLHALGERVRALRMRRGFTRRATAQAAGISERHLASLELGTGNASILLLQQVATALQCPLSDLVEDPATTSPEWLLIHALLKDRTEMDLRRARLALGELLGAAPGNRARLSRVALIGLRGAGKSTLGSALAASLGLPFVELSREIERVAGLRIDEIHSLYGPAAYRRYERRALEETLGALPAVVLATPGGLVSEPATFELLRSRFFTVWLEATPEDHMSRVVAQGDLRPMSGHAEAMDDLRRILAGRKPFYAQADLVFNTSGLSAESAAARLVSGVQTILSANG